MAGNVAEAHYDGGRNWIVLLGGGQRRYILGHPRECPNLALYPVNHPSGRHSSVDWSEIGRLPKSQSPAARALSHAQVTQVVLQASDALFLPVSDVVKRIILIRSKARPATCYSSGTSFSFLVIDKLVPFHCFA